MQASEGPAPRPSETPAATGGHRADQSTVAVVATTPESVLEDFQRAMVLGGVNESLDAAIETLLKLNISRHHWYPACSTTPC